MVETVSEGERQEARAQVLRLVAGYLLAIAAAELVTAVVHPLWGVLLHLLLLVMLLYRASTSTWQPERALMLALTVTPMIRIVSLGMPLGSFGDPWPYALAGIPLTVAGFMLLDSIPLSMARVGLRLPRREQWPLQLVVIASGLLLGLAEYAILRPDPMVAHFDIVPILVAAVVLTIGTGFVEEFLFRGILQTTADDAIGGWTGILFVSVLFGVLHTGHLSVLDVLFVTLVAIYFAVIVARTRTLFGVIFAHGLTNVTLFVMYPLLL